MTTPRRYIVFTAPLAAAFWCLFILHYHEQWKNADIISMIVSTPSYLFEEFASPVLTQKGASQSISLVVLFIGFVLWASALTLPAWFPHNGSTLRRWFSGLWWVACGVAMIGSFIYSIVRMTNHLH